MPLYFIAIVAPEDIGIQVTEWKKYMLDRFGCKVTMRSPAHITLVPPFQMEAHRENDLLSLIEFVWKEQTAFNIRMKDFGSFDSRVIFVDVLFSNELSSLKRRMEDIVFDAGFPIKKETRPFHPHVTIANRDVDKDSFRKAWEHFGKIRYEAAFELPGISLLVSGKEGWIIVERQGGGGRR